MSETDRLALRRQSNKSFTFIGLVSIDSKTEVTVITPDGAAETHSRSGLTFVNFGSLNHFARLDTDGLRLALETSPRSVFEQALLDSTKSLSVTDLKARLTQAGLGTAEVDKAWEQVRKTFEDEADVRANGEGSARKFAWKGSNETRLLPYINASHVIARPIPAPVEAVTDAPAPSPANGQDPLDHSATDATATPVAPEKPPLPDESVAEAASATATLDAAVATAAQTSTPDESALPQNQLLGLLEKWLGSSSPQNLADVENSVLQIGAALTQVPVKDLKALADVPSVERPLVQLLLLARERETKLWASEPGVLDPSAASAAIESAIAESYRTSPAGDLFARFVVRVVQRTDLHQLPLALVAGAFARASALESVPSRSSSHQDLASVLAQRTQTSVGEDWAQADQRVKDVAMGMNRLPLDEEGPRSKFLAALFDIRRQHLDGDLLWKSIELDDLHRAAGGVMRRVLLDPDLAERIVRPAVAQFAAECSTRHDLGKLVALRGTFASYVDERALTTAMSRVAKDDRKMAEWFRGLRQQELLDSVARQRDAAVQEALTAKAATAEAEKRAEKALADRDAASAALKRASEKAVQASEAQLRQAKLDVLRSLASLAVTIRESAAAKDDPALTQRLGFALRREGLVEIADSGETVNYDPGLHDAQGDHIDSGTPVIVSRCGYTYDSRDEQLVLVKAHVRVK